MKPEQLQDSFLKNTEMQYAADYQHIVVQFQSPPTLVPLQNLHVAKGQQMNLSKEVFFFPRQIQHDWLQVTWLPHSFPFLFSTIFKSFTYPGIVVSTASLGLMQSEFPLSN